ncbi:hypothetical protein BY458DRAFT_429613 [Sporodiniella umbellata]|nr:hypothetical protein BY458DRAFT_429613 [Sporodiniella umbellata]
MQPIRSFRFFHACSLSSLVLFTISCFSISAADVMIQALAEHRTDYRHLIVVTTSFVVLKVYSHIQRGWQDTQQTAGSLIPRKEDIQTLGWAKPGTPLFEGLNFKQAVARTPQIVEEAAIQLDASYRRPLYCAVRQYMEFLMGEGVVDPELGKVYLAGYEHARFSPYPIEPGHYMDIMRHLAGLLQNMGYSIKANETGSTLSSHRTGSTYSFRLHTLLSRRSLTPNDSPSVKTRSRPPLLSEESTEFYDEERVRYDIYELLTRT